MLIGCHAKHDNLVVGIDGGAPFVQIPGHVKLEDLTLRGRHIIPCLLYHKALIYLLILIYNLL